jgi:hypothetical protein
VPPPPATTTQYNRYLPQNSFEKATRHPEDAISVQTRIHFAQRRATLYPESHYVSDATTLVVSEFSIIRPCIVIPAEG